MRRLSRGSRLQIGASVSAAASETFNATDYVPSDIQDDITTGRAYYEQFSQAAFSVGPHGSVSMSPAAQEAISGAITGTVLAAFTAAAPGVGAVLALAYALGPKAASGPGLCATDPPHSPYLGDLQSWAHFQSWSGFWGSYTPGAPGSFEAFAYPVLEYNWLLQANCYADKASPAPILLGSLIASWNATHTSDSTRTICRNVIPAAFAGQTYDPIAEALSEAMYVKYTPPLPPNPTFEQATNQTYQGPRSVQTCFTVHNGPVIVKKVLTSLKVRTSNVPLPVAVHLTSNQSSGVGAGTVAVLAAGAAAAYWFGYLGKPLPKFLRRFR
jgi:hypothetical protein